MADDVRLYLVVIRSPDIDRAVKFYEAIGLTFTKHAHGSGPEHYACDMSNGVVFEIYPLRDGDTPTVSTRIGFAVADVDSAVASVTGAGGIIVSAPADSPWGRRAVVADADGHRVELING
ncbi:MAG: bleomycin resistance protein [Phycisphaera sp.]|nr:bleomycin resistance protein [Phycisphaera sp.]